MENKTYLNTRQVAQLLNINEKIVYHLIAEKGLPATKITGKWLFPKHLIDEWIQNETLNYPQKKNLPPSYHGLLIITGSNDILLEKAIAHFNRLFSEHTAVFGNIGSQGGITALANDLCHIASSHLLQENGEEYNFEFAEQTLKDRSPAVVNFSRREQGILLAKGNPKQIKRIDDLKNPDISIANRHRGTGTRLLLDHELEKAEMTGSQVRGYENEFSGHMDVGLEISAGRADAALAIRPIATLLGLDFLPLCWERYDLLISKDRFFEKGVQLFLGILHDPIFRNIAGQIPGYDLSLCGKVVFPP